MADKASKSMWLRFFRDAGIPSGFDTKYALVFDENRIKKDMLMDINKECLRDMGISAMGDIIAILKHAKEVYEEFKAQAYDIPQPTSTVKLLSAVSSSPNGKNISPSSGSSWSSAESSKGEPRSVIINSNKIKTSGNKQPPVTSPSKMVSTTRPKLDVSTISRQIPSTSSSGIGERKSISMGMGGGSRIIKAGLGAGTGSSSAGRPTNSSTIVRLKRSVSPPQREEVPVQKKTRVFPEQEGRYIVKMPAGSTPKTQQLFKDRLGPTTSRSTSQPLRSVEKKHSVFSRLGGEGRVSSSSDVQRERPVISSRSRSPEKPPVKTKSSVFSRLGQGQVSPSKSPSSSSSVPPQRSQPKPLVDRSDFMKTQFEVRQPISSAAARPLSVSRHVLKEERYTNAEGKNMIRKTIVKTVRRKN